VDWDWIQIAAVAVSCVEHDPCKVWTVLNEQATNSFSCMSLLQRVLSFLSFDAYDDGKTRKKTQAATG